MNERILIAVDASEASEEAVRYVGRMFEHAKVKPAIVLFTVVRDPPRSMRSAGILGTIGPISREPEMQGVEDLQQYADRAARPVLEHMVALLEESGVDPARVDNFWYVPRRNSDLEREILDEALRLACETIVVGRNALPWYKELFHSHVADRLARDAVGHTVWIVECAPTEARRPDQRKELESADT